MKQILLILSIAILIGCQQKQQPTAQYKQLHEYQMISPLDTTTLPIIPYDNHRGKIVRNALEKDIIWNIAKQPLIWQDFSAKSIRQMMQVIHLLTRNHYVGISCAYWSQKPNGDSLLVSGQVYLPKNRQLNGIMIASHYMMTADDEVPTNMTAMETLFILKDYAVIMPDLVGYGLSRQEIHPFLHWENAAYNAVDMLDCMPALLDYYGYSYTKDVVVEGYSQGGAVALGVARMIEENNAEWTVRKLYAGAGPYDPASSYDYYVENDYVDIPSLIPLIVFGMNDAYDLQFKMEDIFLEPLLSNYDEWVHSKLYSMKEIDKLMGSTRMSQLMTERALNRKDSMTQKLYHVLSLNNNATYQLRSPADFVHSLDDEMVPLVNTYSVMHAITDNPHITYYLDHYGKHMETSVAFLKHIYRDIQH